jgi:E3 ubiquitin-protein ligase UBR3
MLNGMWERNGQLIKGQAMAYISSCMVDADIYLLQVCATQLSPHTFLDTVATK